MERTRTAWAPFAVLVVGAVGLSVIFATGAVRYEPNWQLVMATATAGTAGVVAVLAWWRFRDSRDPHALLLSAGFAVIAVQMAWFGVWWPVAHALPVAVTAGSSIQAYVPVVGTGPAPVYAWQFGWVIAGLMLVFSNPWWERRGRQPPSPWWVFGVTGVILVLGNVTLVEAYSYVPIPTVRNLYTTFQGGPPSLTGPLRWLLGIIAVGLLLVAAFREWDHLPSRSWLSGAFLLGAALQVAVLAHPTPGLPLVQLADLAQPIVPLLVFIWLLLDQGAATSRSRRAEDRAEAVLTGRAEIASMIAHEVRGPVATVRGIAATSLAHYDRLSDEERREFLSMIEQESVDLLGAVDQMALGLKVDAGALRFDLQPADLAEVVRAGVAAVDKAERLVAVVAEASVIVHADPARLQEVVRQLVDNALKYSPRDTPVTVRAVRDGDHGLIEIGDEGPGIPPDRRDQVVQRFPNWRPPGYEDRPGTGLGLFISGGLLAEHHGEMTIEDGPHGGTMLRVRIPLER